MPEFNRAKMHYVVTLTTTKLRCRAPHHFNYMRPAALQLLPGQECFPVALGGGGRLNVF